MEHARFVILNKSKNLSTYLRVMIAFASEILCLRAIRMMIMGAFRNLQQLLKI